MISHNKKRKRKKNIALKHVPAFPIISRGAPAHARDERKRKKEKKWRGNKCFTINIPALPIICFALVSSPDSVGALFCIVLHTRRRDLS
jgi:hypothetical protein